MNVFKLTTPFGAFALLLWMPLHTLAAPPCFIAATTINFGSYDVFNSTSTTGTARLNVSCPLPYTIEASSGNSGNAQQRQMHFGLYRLSYNLYTDNLYSTIWGNGSSGTALITGRGIFQQHTVYGLLPALQNVASGIYNDTVVIVLSF